MKLINSLADIQKNIEELEKNRQKYPAIPDKYASLIKRGTCFFPYMVDGIVCFAPSRFIGYQGNNLPAHANNGAKDGRITNAAISEVIGHPPRQNDELEELYLKFCSIIGIKPNKRGNFGVERKYWTSDLVLEELDYDEIQSILEDKGINKTQKRQLINARVGQGLFRSELIDYWGSCCLTGCEVTSILRASHIKPWRSSNNFERLDKFNGLLLAPNADALFDKGLISFDDDGDMIVSPKIDEETLKSLLPKNFKRIKINAKHRKYLDFHRKNVFIDGEN